MMGGVWMSIVTEVLAETVAAAQPLKDGNVHTVDFSQVDMFVGLIIGVAITGIITFLVIWALIKAKVFTLGAPMVLPVKAAGGVCGDNPTEHLVRIQVPRDCNEHKAEKERSKRNEESILKLWAKYDEMTKQISNGIEMLHANQLKLLVGLVQSGVLDAKYVPDSIGTTRLKGGPA